MQNTLLSEIQSTKNIDDTIELLNKHKEILTRLKSTNTNLLNSKQEYQEFLNISFKIFEDDKEYYGICVDLLNTMNEITLPYFKDVIDDICKIKEFYMVGQELRLKLKRRSYTEPESSVKRTPRIKKVSFVDQPIVKLIECELSTEHNYKNLRDESRNEFPGNEDYLKRILLWSKPERIENVTAYVKKGQEVEVQKNRENDTLGFRIDNTEDNFKPVHIIKDKPNIVKIGEPKIMPLMNLKVQNVWKKLDFIKIIKETPIDLKEILEDPEIINKFG